MAEQTDYISILMYQILQLLLFNTHFFCQVSYLQVGGDLDVCEIQWLESAIS